MLPICTSFKQEILINVTGESTCQCCHAGPSEDQSPVLPFSPSIVYLCRGTPKLSQRGRAGSPELDAHIKCSAKPRSGSVHCLYQGCPEGLGIN